MASLGKTFKPDEVEADEFEPIPAGDYLVQVSESEMVPTKNGNGQMLKLTYEILSGPYEGRKLWDRLNIINTNTDAQRIAWQQLKKLCEALGIDAMNDSEVLHFKPVTATIAIRPAKGEYGPQNVLRKFTPVGEMGQKDARPKEKPAASSPPPSKGAGKRPWEQKPAS